MKPVNASTRTDTTFRTPDVHSMGRRSWQRVSVNHPVSLHGTSNGTERSMRGLAVDLSRGGILVAVDDPAVIGDRDGLLTRVEERFPQGLEIRFHDVDIVRTAKIARVMLSPCANVGIGCAFNEDLTTREALKLGIVAGEARVPEVRLETLPFEPRPGVGLSLLLEDGSGDLVGPFALGPVTGAGELSVDATFPQDVSDLVENCGDNGFHAALVVGMERLWEGAAQLVICEAAKHGGSCVRVLFPASFDKRLAQCLRRKAG